jgi:hypothetical protein
MRFQWKRMLLVAALAACGPTKDAVRQVGEDVVDCTTVTASAHTAEYGARIEKAIKEHTANGETDWSKVGAVVGEIMREAGVDVAGCVARATFERLLGARTLTGPDLREGWERVRADALGGRRFLPEVTR